MFPCASSSSKSTLQKKGHHHKSDEDSNSSKSLRGHSSDRLPESAEIAGPSSQNEPQQQEHHNSQIQREDDSPMVEIEWEGRSSENPGDDVALSGERPEVRIFPSKIGSIHLTT
jgi:hypothetical protein